MENPKQSKVVVAAMDFGTTYSGYAFSLRDKPFEFQGPQAWYAGSTKLVSSKTPTCVLVRKDKTFDSFGFQAENKYAELTSSGNHGEWYFFQHFKMMLNREQKLSKNTLIEDIAGKTMLAFDVFTMAIRYLKDHLMDTIKDRTVGLTINDVHFVLTVPAIWDDPAKQFMREAAEEAGIDKESLTLALEPEAASVYCQLNPTHVSTNQEVSKWRSGTQFMVIDLGGGTADITCHEKQIDGTLKELYKASGGPWGGLNVNHHFINFLTDIFGKGILERFKQEEIGDYFELMREFEIRKREILPFKEGDEIIRMPVSFKELYEENCNQTVQEAISQSRYKGKLTWQRDKLKIEAKCLRELFKPPINSVTQHIKMLLMENSLRSISQILLVGGFAECRLVQNSICTSFPEMQTIIPNDSGLIVLKGAVCYGHKPCISSRILRYTYGVESDQTYDSAIHPETAKYTDSEGNVWCKGYFDIIKTIGSSVAVGETVSLTSKPLTTTQDKMGIRVFTSTKEAPTLVNEKECKMIGKLTVKLPSYTGKKRKVQERYIFGETELLLKAVEPTSEMKYEAYFDLL